MDVGEVVMEVYSAYLNLLGFPNLGLRPVNKLYVADPSTVTALDLFECPWRL